MHKIADFMHIQGDYVKRLLICLHHNHMQSLIKQIKNFFKIF